MHHCIAMHGTIVTPQASFRRKMGRVYRKLLKQAKVALATALRAVHAAQDVGQRELQMMDDAVAGYHQTMGRFGQIFAEYEPPEYEEMLALKRGMKERIELHGLAQPVLGASPPDLHQLIHVKERYAVRLTLPRALHLTLYALRCSVRLGGGI